MALTPQPTATSGAPWTFGLLGTRDLDVRWHASPPPPARGGAARRPFEDYAPRTAFGIGMIHGVGAETPTQVLIFLTAAGVGNKGTGVLLLACFLIGLLAANTVVALAGTAGLVGVRGNRHVYVAVSLLTAVFGGAIGLASLPEARPRFRGCSAAERPSG